MYGAVVSSMTGRQSFSGHFSWTPNFIARENAARGIFTGQMGRRQAGAVLRRSGARFVLADCRFPPPVVERRLGDAVTPVRIFGCAGVYRINGAAGT
jgi:hypothetical protein